MPRDQSELGFVDWERREGRRGSGGRGTGRGEGVGDDDSDRKSEEGGPFNIL